MRYFLQGLTLGLAYLAPIGVQNMYAINAGLTQPGKKAYHIALAIIFFDIALALACFFGGGALLEYFPVLKLGILLGGSLVLLFIGKQAYRGKDAPAQQPGCPDSLFQSVDHGRCRHVG